MLTARLRQIDAGSDLTAAEAAETIRMLVDGRSDPAQAAELLVAWRRKGETADEILGAARALRGLARAFGPVPQAAVDTCGTGGDGTGSVNLSTLAGLVVAAAGHPVVKHGNRSVSSRCGSADLLDALGIRPDAGPETVSRCLEATGFGFLFAPAYHPAMRRLAAVRRALGTPTILNLLGPLANPAGVRRQVVGVSHPRYLAPVAEALRGLGSEHALVVHSRDGLDEISVCDGTDAVEVRAGRPNLTVHIHPEAIGLRCWRPGALRGGDPGENAAAALAVLGGADGPVRDAVVANAAAALRVGGAVATVAAGVERARSALDSGAAMRTLEALRRLAPAVPAPPAGGEG